MLITFSKEFYAQRFYPHGAGTASFVVGVVDEVSVKKYRLTWENDSPIGNLAASITWWNGRRVRFTLETRDAWKRGSRTSASGRHMRKASWEAHRDVLAALFELDAGATIKTTLAIYRGREDFEAKFPATGDKNVGSIIEPRTMKECSI